MELDKFVMTDQSTVTSDQYDFVAEDDICDLPTTSEIQTWMISYLAQMLEVNPDEIDITIPFDRYGLDSSAVVGMTGDLEDWLKIELDPTIVYDYPTIKALTKHIAEEL